MPESVTLLHLSDLQFGRFHRFPERSSEDNPLDSLAERLVLDLAELRASQNLRPDLLVLTGDIAEWGRRSEFDAAAAFVRRLADALELPISRVAILPGNHDVNRKACEAYFNQCEAREIQPVKPYWPKWEFYKAFFDDLYRDVGVTFTPETPWTLFEYDDLKTVIAGFNSTMAESHLDDDHYGWLGEVQMRWFAERLRTYEERGWLRIGALHHNVRRGPVADDENLRDAEELRSIAGRSLNLVLHGHTHDGRSDLLARHVPIYSTGSAAVNADARPPEVPNQYQILKITRDRVVRYARAYMGGTDRCFGGDVRASEDKDNWKVVEPCAFQGVEIVFPFLERIVRPDEPPPENPKSLDEIAALEHASWGRTKNLWLSQMPDDFVARVARVCQLRHGGEADIQQFRNATDPLPYLSVSCREGAFTNLYAIGVAERTPTLEVVRAFGGTIHARYRASDPGVRSLLVYGGNDLISDAALQEAHRFGFNVQSWIEYQGLIHLRPLVDAQSDRLQRDPRYPSALYVPQRYSYSVGNEERSGTDALEAVLDLMKSPEGRFVVVLGEFGTGKSFLLRQLALELATLDRPLPIFVEMRTLEKGRSLDELIAQHLVRSGQEDIKLKAFRYMLEQGRVALLFDGFDELVVRVTYQRAAEHLETLLQAASGQAKVVVTSRTQFFETDQQVRTILGEKLDVVGGRNIVRLQRFDRPQIEQFLTRLLGNREESLRRMALLDDVKDLMGLSENPRMLSFIAELDRADLERARGIDGKVTSADLYRVLIERWLKFEIDRIEPRGAAPGLTLSERWNAVNVLGRYLWEKTEPTVRLSEVGDQVAATIGKLPHLDPDDVTHQVGSGTLLVRDPDGNFSFVHQSVLEWLVANRAAEELKAGTLPRALVTKEMSQLMVDFFIALATPAKAREWAADRGADAAADPIEKKNAVAILGRLPQQGRTRLELADTDLRGQELSGRDLRDADLTGANLVGVSLSRADLRGAKLAGAQLADADLSSADLRDADLTNADLQRVRAVGADFHGARLDGVRLKRAKLLLADSDDRFARAADTFGAAIDIGEPVQPVYESGAYTEVMEWSPTGETVIAGAANTVRWFDIPSGRELRTYRIGSSAIIAIAVSGDGRTLYVVCADRVHACASDTGRELWTTPLRHRPIAARIVDDRGLLIVVAPPFLEEIRLQDGSIAARVALPPSVVARSVEIDETGNTVIVQDRGTVVAWKHRHELTTVARRPHSADAFAASASPMALVYVANGTLYRFADKSWSRVAKVIPDGITPTALALSPDGNWAVVLYEAKVVLVELASGRMKTLGIGYSATFSRDSTRVAVNLWDTSIAVYDVAQGVSVRRVAGQVFEVIAAQAADTIRTVSATEVVQWDLAIPQRVSTLKLPHSDLPMRAAAISPSGNRIALLRGDHLELVWTDSGSRQMRPVSPQSSIVALAEENAYAYGDQHEVICVSSDTQRTTFQHQTLVTAAAFLRASRPTSVLVTADFDYVHLWRTSGAHVDKFNLRPSGLYRVEKIHVSHVGLVLLQSQSGNGLVLRMAGERITPIRTVTAGRWGALSQDGAWVAVCTPGSVVISSVDESTPDRVVATTADYGVAAFTADSRRLFIFGQTGRVEVIDVESGTLVATYGLGAQSCVGFRPDGRYRMSGDLGGSFGHSIRLCRFEPGEVPELDAILRLPDDEPLI